MIINIEKHYTLTFIKNNVNFICLVTTVVNDSTSTYNVATVTTTTKIGSSSPSTTQDNSQTSYSTFQMTPSESTTISLVASSSPSTTQDNSQTSYSTSQMTPDESTSISVVESTVNTDVLASNRTIPAIAGIMTLITIIIILVIVTVLVVIIVKRKHSKRGNNNYLISDNGNSLGELNLNARCDNNNLLNPTYGGIIYTLLKLAIV